MKQINFLCFLLIIFVILSSKVDLSSAWLLVHGTTMGLNALIRRSGAKTALITTKGFRDVLEIARMGRDDLYNIWFQRSAPLVPRPLRFELEEHFPLAQSLLLATG